MKDAVSVVLAFCVAVLALTGVYLIGHVNGAQKGYQDAKVTWYNDGFLDGECQATGTHYEDGDGNLCLSATKR